MGLALYPSRIRSSDLLGSLRCSRAKALLGPSRRVPKRLRSRVPPGVSLRLNPMRITMREVHTNGKREETNSPYQLHGRRGRSFGVNQVPENCDRREADELQH